MAYRDLRDFMAQLEATGDLRRVAEPVSPHLEMTALSDRVLRAGGPALLFTQPTGHRMPVLTNLFGTTARVARAMGVADLRGVRALGELLATLKEPEAPKGLKDMLGMGQLLKTLWNMAPHTVARGAPCQQEVWEGPDVDLARLPVQHCWPGDVAPLITWGLTITRGPRKARQNLGIYRQQVLSRNQVIVRWLAHRGGAQHYARHRKAGKREPLPAAVVLGADPGTILAAVTPVPDTLSEYQFAGLMRGAKAELVPCKTVPLMIPAQHLHAVDAQVEIVLGRIRRALGHHQPPCDQGRRFAGPAGLDRQLCQVDVVALENDLMHRGLLHHLWPHAHDRLGQRQHVHRILESARRGGVLQEGQQFAHLAQLAGGGAFLALQGDAHGHPLHGAEQVDQAGHGRALAVGADDVFEQHRRAAALQQAALDLGHLEVAGHRLGDPDQFARGLQLDQELAQRSVCHGGGLPGAAEPV